MIHKRSFFNKNSHTDVTKSFFFTIQPNLKMSVVQEGCKNSRKDRTCERVTDIAIFFFVHTKAKTGNHGWLTIHPARASSSPLSKELSRTHHPFVLHPFLKPPTKRQSWPQSGQCQFLRLQMVCSFIIFKDFLSTSSANDRYSFPSPLSHYSLISSLYERLLVKLKKKDRITHFFLLNLSFYFLPIQFVFIIYINVFLLYIFHDRKLKERPTLPGSNLRIQ